MPTGISWTNVTWKPIAPVARWHLRLHKLLLRVLRPGSLAWTAITDQRRDETDMPLLIQILSRDVTRNEETKSTQPSTGGPKCKIT